MDRIKIVDRIARFDWEDELTDLTIEQAIATLSSYPQDAILRNDSTTNYEYAVVLVRDENDEEYNTRVRHRKIQELSAEVGNLKSAIKSLEKAGMLDQIPAIQERLESQKRELSEWKLK